MALLPVLRRLLAEDFSDQASWIGKLLYPLNLFMGSAYAALNHGITFQDNFLAQVKTLTVKGSSPTVQFLYSYASAGTPIGVVPIATRDTSPTPAVITTPVTCTWSYSSGAVSIDNVTGLNPTKQYAITFLVIGG